MKTKLKRTSRRLLSALLSVIIVVTLFTVVPFGTLTASADEPSEPMTGTEFASLFGYIHVNNKITITSYMGDATDLVIPSEVVDEGVHYTVDTIGNGTARIASTTKLTSVVIPSSVNTINASAFGTNSNLTSVTINGSGNTEIKGWSFGSCSKLKSLTMNNVKIIRKSAFASCSALESVTIPKTAQTVEGGAFQQCKKLTEILVESKDAEHPNESSYYKSIDGNLYKLTSGNPVTLAHFAPAKTYAAADPYPANTFVVPDGVTTIDTSAFMTATKLEYIRFPSTLNTINSGAFEGCSSLLGLNIPEGNTKYATDDSGALFTVNNAGNKSKIIFFSPVLTGSYTIPEPVTTIGQGSFTGTQLTSIIIPDTVTKIEQHAFNSSKLTSITVPDSVTSIGSEAFNACYWLLFR